MTTDSLLADLMQFGDYVHPLWKKYREAFPTMALGIERSASILRYLSPCLATDKDHDWRYASNAPGWVIGDDCARCQNCQQSGIKPAEANK